MKEESSHLDRRKLMARAGAGALTLALPSASTAWAKDNDKKLYIQEGKDPTFKELLKRKAFPIGKNSTGGVKGSKINVNNKLLSKVPHADKPIPSDIRIHTLCHSFIQRKDFPKWTRWYQEDGSTQVFRLFKDEHNVRNKRKGAARVEAFTKLEWGKGDWHAWQGTYTLVRPHGAAIFQAKNDNNDWGVMINTNSEGDIKLNHRTEKDITIARGMAGKSFTLGIRDNGHDYEVYYNKKKVGEGSYARPKGMTRFRWGMYDGTVQHDAMIFVTGVWFQ
jgi:hypothetical protein